MDTTRLTTMVNQIARNIAPQGDEAAIAQTAQHIADYWDPRMKAAIKACDPSQLDPLAAQALARLAA